MVDVKNIMNTDCTYKALITPENHAIHRIDEVPQNGLVYCLIDYTRGIIKDSYTSHVWQLL